MSFEKDNDPKIKDIPMTSPKNVGSKSMFDDLPKKPKAEQLNSIVQGMQNKTFQYKTKFAELGKKIMDMMRDQTLKTNKNTIMSQLETDTLKELLSLSSQVDNDDAIGMNEGAISCIALLFNTCLIQRDKINNLEYLLQQIKNDKKSIAQLEIKDVK